MPAVTFNAVAKKRKINSSEKKLCKKLDNIFQTNLHYLAKQLAISSAVFWKLE